MTFDKHRYLNPCQFLNQAELSNVLSIQMPISTLVSLKKKCYFIPALNFSDCVQSSEKRNSLKTELATSILHRVDFVSNHVLILIN